MSVPCKQPIGETCRPSRFPVSWWRHQMETFSALLAICAGNSPVPGEFAAQRPVTRNFDVSFDLRPNKLLCKQSWRWWFETPSRPLWRHRNGVAVCCSIWLVPIRFMTPMVDGRMVNTLTNFVGGEKGLLTSGGLGFETTHHHMKQFAHNWDLPCCHCTKTCSGVSSIQKTYPNSEDVLVNFYE